MVSFCLVLLVLSIASDIAVWHGLCSFVGFLSLFASLKIGSFSLFQCSAKREQWFVEFWILQSNGFITVRSWIFNELLNEWLQSTTAIKYDRSSIGFEFECGKMITCGSFHWRRYENWLNITDLNIIIGFSLCCWISGQFSNHTKRFWFFFSPEFYSVENSEKCKLTEKMYTFKDQMLLLIDLLAFSMEQKPF